MKRYLTLLALLTMLLPLSAQTSDDLEELYREIDKAIKESPKYVKAYKNTIARREKDYNKETVPERKCDLAMEMFTLYKGFMNDSAIAYLERTIELAEQTNRPALAGKARALMARQCSNAGMYIEANDILKTIDTQTLDTEGIVDYYDACMHLSGEVANYSSIPEVRDFYYVRRDTYRDSLLAVAEKYSGVYKHLEVMVLIARNRFQDALSVSDRWMSSVEPNTPEEAFAAYYRHVIYDKLGNETMTKYWLARSAIDDVTCAVMDQASLILLADLLNRDGDYARSYNYIRFTWECSKNFNTRMRTWQMTPVLSVIENSYQATVRRSTTIIMVAAVVSSVLAILLAVLFVLYRRQRKALAQAQKQ